MKKTFLFFLLISAFLLQAQEKEISKSIYFTANTGIEKNSKADKILKAIVESSQKDKNAAFVAIGNITRNNGYLKDDEARKSEEEFLKRLLMEPLENFNGEVIYTPGYHEWNKGGHKNLDDLESYLQDNSKAEFWPNDGCPLERETLSDQVELVMVDSQWFLEDWDNYPYINNKCEIKTREQFFIEFKDELKDEQNKTVIVAVHHPVLSATRKGFFGRMGGFSKQNYYNNTMQDLVGRLETLASQFEDVIFVSGNHKNLQFLEDDGIPQIISGAVATTEKTRPETDKGFYGSNAHGFVKLNAYKDGSSEVEIYEIQPNGAKKVYSKEIKSKRGELEDFTYHQNSDFGATFKASIYTKEETDKSGFYTWAWGEHYRPIYSRKIQAPVLFLDSLPHNLRALRAGGGNQSRTLRLINDQEHEYNIRELRKSAVRFIQSAIPDHYIRDYMRNTIAEDIVQDFYTTAHPYAPFAVGDLLDAVNIYHANPEIVYVPKQKRLGRFNETYGDKLYMFEEHVGDENKTFETFGNADDILSTSDMLLEIRDDNQAKIDEDLYIRARLFDMLIGDWDRHADQWRWSKFEQEDGTELYKPIPRDRDQAFPKYDGPIIQLLKFGVPLIRPMQTYSAEVKDVKWLNHAGYYLDKTFINQTSWEDWKTQAEYLQNHLTDDVIDKAFGNLLPDVQDESIENIKASLKQRRDNMLKITRDYYDYFKKHEVIVATDEDSKVNIVREPNGITKITIDEEDRRIFDNQYTKEETKEIWIYSLDGNDTFTASGEGNNLIKIKVFGGEENDTYNFENRKRIKVYDYKSKENTYKNVGGKRLTDSYEINNYDPQKRKYTQNIVLPSLGFSSDEGFKIGLTDQFTTYGLMRNPFTTQHTVTANYYAATQGIEFMYYGEFAHIFYNWNFGLDARYTSDKFATNFFGVGNQSSYDDDAVSKDYNRTKIKQWHVAPSLIYKENETFTAHIEARIESNEVADKDNGFAEDFFNASNDVYDQQLYAGGEVGVNFNNKGSLIGYPRRGIELDLKAGYKSTLEKKYDNQFGYVKPTVSFVYPIHESGAATIATLAKANFILGDNYEFYHAARLGGNESLRGYRNERFLGKTSFFQSTDLRVGITKFRTNFVPIRVGVSAGFDYGRVWVENDTSEKWHNSYGGSVFINGFNALTANIGYYRSSEDQRILFTLGFKF